MRRVAQETKKIHLTGDNNLSTDAYIEGSKWALSPEVQAHFEAMNSNNFLTVITTVTLYDKTGKSGHLDYLTPTGFQGVFRFELDMYPEVYPGIEHFQVGEVIRLTLRSSKIRRVEKVAMTAEETEALMAFLEIKFRARREKQKRNR